LTSIHADISALPLLDMTGSNKMDGISIAQGVQFQKEFQ